LKTGSTPKGVTVIFPEHSDWIVENLHQHTGSKSQGSVVDSAQKTAAIAMHTCSHRHGYKPRDAIFRHVRCSWQRLLLVNDYEHAGGVLRTLMHCSLCRRSAMCGEAGPRSHGCSSQPPGHVQLCEPHGSRCPASRGSQQPVGLGGLVPLSSRLLKVRCAPAIAYDWWRLVHLYQSGT